MPLNLKDKLPRGKVELAITNWFKEKTTLQSICITEPIYTEDMTDRIDAVLFLGGFDISKMLSDLEQKVLPLKKLAIEKGFMTEDGSFIIKVEENPAVAEVPIVEPSQVVVEPPTPIAQELPKESPVQTVETLRVVDIASIAAEIASAELPTTSALSKIEEEPIVNQPNLQSPLAIAPRESTSETQTVEVPTSDIFEKTEEKIPQEKPKRGRRKKGETLSPIMEEETEAP
jgi:hypothetical protein